MSVPTQTSGYMVQGLHAELAWRRGIIVAWLARDGAIDDVRRRGEERGLCDRGNDHCASARGRNIQSEFSF